MSNYDEINYKRMYESSQSSLSDMASKHAETLSRIGRIRSGVSLILKRNFPNLFSYAEKHSNAKISELDDEIILAYLETFIKTGSESYNNINLDGVREALSRLGINFQGTTLASLISFLDELEKQGFKIANTPEPEALPTHPLAVKIIEDEGDLVMNIFDDLIDSDRWSPSPVSTPQNKNTATNLTTEQNTISASNPVVSQSQLPSTIDPYSGPEYIAPLRPEIVKHSSPRARRGKPIKVQATRPEKPLFENLTNTSFEEEKNSMSNDFINKLIEAASINRPMFIRDLSAVANTREDAEKWEEICRLDPANYPVRFIGAKVRHKNRGSLVIPANSRRMVGENISDNWWWNAVDLYRGAKLYELGVLLNRLGKDLKDFSFTSDSSLLHIDTKKGLLSIVVLYGNTMLGDDQSIGKLFNQLQSENPYEILFLQTQSEDSAIEKTISKLKYFKDELNWNPTCSVKVAYSWEFAEDRGTSAVSIT